jgi:hypothetical protein
MDLNFGENLSFTHAKILVLHRSAVWLMHDGYSVAAASQT